MPDHATLPHIVPTPTPSDTSVIISGLPAGSECNITLAAVYNGDSNVPVNFIATTLLDGAFQFIHTFVYACQSSYIVHN